MTLLAKLALVAAALFILVCIVVVVRARLRGNVLPKKPDGTTSVSGKMIP